MTPTALRELKLAFVLITIVMVPVLFTFLLREDISINAPISPESLEELAQEYRSNGVESFLNSKSQLRKRVSRGLKDDTFHDRQMAAMNLAVYLFPELLDDTNLEKGFAQDNFSPLQRKIESAPGTTQAQKHFEELRNMVWNYENPKQTEQGLSEYARQMLKLYGTLSWK